MSNLHAPIRWLSWCALALTALQAHCQLVINEVLFNPPGSDAPNEYIELRGTPNLVIPPGTYFLAVEGDLGANPGSMNNIFDLSNQRVGGNGFLVLLQKDNAYAPHTNATVLVNTGSGAGWGSGSSSSINHRGTQTDLENASVSFFLIQTTSPVTLSTDIDSNNDGMPDGDAYASWTVLDSVGIVGTSGTGYGAINFFRSPGITPVGISVTVGFSAGYVARSSNTLGSAQAAWVAGTLLAGAAPAWTLGTTTDTAPSSFAAAALNHIGAPNFGAPEIPGVLLLQSNGSTDVGEGSGTDSYALALNTTPAGSVTVQITANPQVEVSVNAGPFAATASLTLTDKTPKTVTVRAIDDAILANSPHLAFVSHSISATADPVQYPMTTFLPRAQVNITENEWLLWSEIKANPPGQDDTLYQYLELVGPPNMPLTNVYLMAIDGDTSGNPGDVDWLLNLTGAQLGANGLLIVAPANYAQSFPAGTPVITDPEINALPDGFHQGTVSFLIVSSPTPIPLKDKDLDNGDNGVLEDLPAGSTILDAVGWSDGGSGDIVYGGVNLNSLTATPDAAVRFPGNTDPRSTAAWFYGDLAGTNANSLFFDGAVLSTNFPVGAILSPGFANNVDLRITHLAPLSGVIDDPTNPEVTFQVSDSSANSAALVVSAASSNPSVIPDGNLILIPGPNGSYRLRLAPVGVGYATITISIASGGTLAVTTFPYAASAMGRPGGHFHAGASDASAAFAIDPDWMFVGDDQNNVIRMFHRSLSGPAHEEFDFKPDLQVTAQEGGEVDIEAVTSLGNRIFWMGSHSHNNRAESRTNRTRIFATDISGSSSNASLSFAGMYRYLKVDVIDWDRFNLHGKGSNYYGLEASSGPTVDPKADDGSGFNFEGLTMAPGSTTVGWLAFRAPLVPVTNRSRALILPVLSFPYLAISGADPGATSFGTPIELNLGCRGVRSIESNPSGVMIVAGPPGNGGAPSARDFKLYTWSGQPNDLPEEHATDLAGLNPEALVGLPPAPWTASSIVQLVSDNGNTVYYGDDIPAKHLEQPNFKKFRSDHMALGAVTTPQPCIKSVSVNATTVFLAWCSMPGVGYRVQYKQSLNDPAWTDLSVANITATDSVTFSSFPRTAATGFFRVKAL